MYVMEIFRSRQAFGKILVSSRLQNSFRRERSFFLWRLLSIRDAGHQHVEYPFVASR